MAELFSRAKHKLSKVSEEGIHLPNRSSIETMRDELNQATDQIVQILNPSPLAHVMNDTAEAVENLVSRNSVVEANVSKAVEWNVRHVKHGLHVVKRMAGKVGELDQVVSVWRDKFLTRLMEVKSCNFVPEPFERIFC